MQTNNYNTHKTSGQRSGLDRRNLVDENYKGFERRIAEDRRGGLERRKHKRFLVKESTIVTLWSERDKDYVENMGKLLDISQAGLALRCTAKLGEATDYSLLEILLAGYDFNIDEIPLKIISVVEMTSDSTWSELTLRRYGVQFDSLTPDQISKLDYFLANHTLGQA